MAMDLCHGHRVPSDSSILKTTWKFRSENAGKFAQFTLQRYAFTKTNSCITSNCKAVLRLEFKQCSGID